MAEETQAQAAPPLPPKGAIVSDRALYLTEISLYRNSLAFSGTRNPSAIWASMVYNQPWTIAYYRELEDKDEDVANCLDSLKLSVLQRARSVQPANDNDSRAVDVKEFIEAQLTPLDFHAVLDCVLDAPGYGFSVQEMMFDVSGGQASLIGIDDCPQELFLFGNRYYPQIGPLQFLEQPWASEGVPVPEEKFLITTYRKRARNRMGRPLLKSVFWPSWFKRNMQRLWVQFAEKGPGTAVVRYNDADNESEKRKAAEIAQAIIESVAVGVPKNFDIEIDLLKMARAQDPSVYEHFFQAMQYSIARRILGETLTSFGNEGGTGAKAQGQVHADTLEQRSIEMCRAVETVINNQLVRPLVMWNFGPDAPMPTWSFDTEEEEDLLQRLTIDAGLQRMGKKFTVGYIVDRYDVPLAEGENPESPTDILQPNISAPNVAITDQARASFAEPSAEAQVHGELLEFDKLFEQLRADSTGILRKRTEEIARQVTPITRK
jgi:phage gp29-like protein